MRFFWVRDRIRQRDFFSLVPWKKYRADYFTKHHAPLHHKEMRSISIVNLLSNWTIYHEATQNDITIERRDHVCSKGVLVST